MEKERTKEEQKLIEKIDKAISELVYEKVQVIKAYNYYHGKRDPEQFRHLEENYGIGTPTSVEFIPLVRKHLDVLIGEYLSTPVLPRVSCKDSSTLEKIEKEKTTNLNNKIFSDLKSKLKEAVFSNNYQLNTKADEHRLNELQESFDLKYMSNYEIAGQNIVDWSMQNRSLDFANKRKILLTDLLVTGMSYYKVHPSSNKTNCRLSVLNPINTFIDRNPESPYLKDSARAVVRKYLTKTQILQEYGDYLTQEDLDKLDTFQDFVSDGSSTYIRSSDTTSGSFVSDGILGGFEVTVLLPGERVNSKYFRTYPCYEVEWLQADKENGKYITNRYEGIRIGSNIYIPLGKSEEVIRSIDDPNRACLSVNGMFYSDRNGEPFSLVLKTATLQDKNDVLHFYRDNLIATSGTVGNWVDVAHLPKFLGNNLTERLIKWEAYAKNGKKLFDSSQEGQVVNTAFNNFDDTVKVQAIQAIELAIEQNEQTCSNITGVFREKLGGIEQKDAVSNVQVGVRQSSYITKHYYQIMDLLTREILIDILNLSKIVYKKGISGTVILGENLNKFFTALPKYYTVTDYDISIADSAEIIKEQETIKQMTMELTKGGLVEPDILIDMVTSKSLTKMKEDVKESLFKKKSENDQMGKLSQQVQQLDQQLKQTTQEAQSLQQEVQKLNAEKLQLEKDRLEFEKQLKWFIARDESAFNQEKLELEKKGVELEGAQLLDINKSNDEIKNNTWK